MKRYRNAMAFAAMIALLLVLLVMNLCIGSSSVPVSDVWLALTGRATDATVANVVLQLRLPRALAAIVLGGALALSGYLLQTFFHNPIAGPFILGISSGAKLTVAIAMVFALKYPECVRRLSRPMSRSPGCIPGRSAVSPVSI